MSQEARAGLYRGPMVLPSKGMQIERIRFEVHRTRDWQQVIELVADGWQLTHVIVVGAEAWHYLERPAAEVDGG